ncbi:MAG: hypothetical protein ACR2NM_07610, partial [Bythopirellula sp.]
MAKVGIKQLAASAEIVASIAVVVSLLLVVGSIDQNTKSMQSINDNFLYDLQNQHLRDVANDGELASIVNRFWAGEDLTSAETLRYRFWMSQELNMWDLAFTRHNDGLMPARQWDSWNNYWSANVPVSFPEAWWSAAKNQYPDDFVAHVDAAYAQH